MTLRVSETLSSPDGRLQFAYFPTSSIVTLSYPLEEGGAMAKGWSVGREGMVGISLLLDGPKCDNRADVQVGGLAFRLPASVLLVEFRRANAFQNLLLRYVSALITQASQLGVCSHYHSIEQRLCRFLSRIFDRVPGDEVALTQERMGELRFNHNGCIAIANRRHHRISARPHQAYQSGEVGGADVRVRRSRQARV